MRKLSNGSRVVTSLDDAGLLSVQMKNEVQITNSIEFGEELLQVEFLFCEVQGQHLTQHKKYWFVCPDKASQLKTR